MTVLAFIAGLVVGAFALVGVVVTYRAIRLHFRPTYPARILVRQLPSHVKEGRILVNGTGVRFSNHDAVVDGYRREPGVGNFYLVIYSAPYGEISRWIPDTRVWEHDELRRVA